VKDCYPNDLVTSIQRIVIHSFDKWNRDLDRVYPWETVTFYVYLDVFTERPAHLINTVPLPDGKWASIEVYTAERKEDRGTHGTFGTRVRLSAMWVADHPYEAICETFYRLSQTLVTGLYDSAFRGLRVAAPAAKAT